MNVETILKAKGRDVVVIKPEASIREAVKLLRGMRIGALIVSQDGNRVVGVLSERDVVHGLADHGASLLDHPVSDLMSRQVITCAPDDSVAELMAQMTDRRIRHIPVVDRGRLAGIVSIGDVVKNRLDEMEWEASSLRQFIAGAA